MNLHKALAEAFASNGTAPVSPALSSSSPHLRHTLSVPRSVPTLGPATNPQPASVPATVKVAGRGGVLNGRGARILIADDDKGQVITDGGGA